MWRRLGLRGAITVRGGRFNVRAGGVVLEVFDTARGDWVGEMRVRRFGTDAGKWLSPVCDSVRGGRLTAVDEVTGDST